MEDIQKTVGKFIKDYRIKRRLTQEELAYRAGIHPSYLSYLEMGKKSPSLSTLQKIAEILNVPIQAFLGPVPKSKIAKYDPEIEKFINIIKDASATDKDFIRKAIRLINKKRR